MFGPIEVRERGPWDRWQPIYEVNAPKDGKDAMPSGTKIEDYKEWSYDQKNNLSRFEIEFDSIGNVKVICCYSNDKDFTDWGPVAGIHSGDNEEKLLKLGKPTLDTIEQVTRILTYSDIGLKYYLSKGQVYMVKMYQPKKGKIALVSRFLNTLF